MEKKAVKKGYKNFLEKKKVGRRIRRQGKGRVDGGSDAGEGGKEDQMTKEGKGVNKGGGW